MPIDARELADARSTVDSLLAEPVDAVRQREHSAFENWAGSLRDSIVLFGAGGLGRRCLAGLRGYGIEPLAFADNNPCLWGTDVDGVPVLSPDEAAKRFRSTAVFIVTIWGARPSDRMNDRLSALRSKGCEKVIPFGPPFWRYPTGVLPHYGADLPHKVVEQSTQVLQALELWGDAESRREYVAQLKWRLHFDFASLGSPNLDTIYFPPDLIRLRPDEVFIDCGAFDGDTVRQFFHASTGLFEKVVAFEPDPNNFARLTNSVIGLPHPVRQRVQVSQAAVGETNGSVRFSAHGDPSSHVGAGDLDVEVVALDRYLGSDRATFIKMDIEGAEPDALAGARRQIRDHAPILAISCYHRQDHLWAIPLLIHSINSDYVFYLRPHDLEGWDLVCYAVPRSRLLPVSRPA